MQHGVYYAYWEREWGGDYKYYIEKAAKLGFDILEIAAGPLPDYTEKELNDLKSTHWNFTGICSKGWKKSEPT